MAQRHVNKCTDIVFIFDVIIDWRTAFGTEIFDAVKKNGTGVRQSVDDEYIMIIIIK